MILGLCPHYSKQGCISSQSNIHLYFELVPADIKVVTTPTLHGQPICKALQLYPWKLSVAKLFLCSISPKDTSERT
jgi:hypothetical protein